MDNKERIEKSGENHLKGFNCAQSIACAYSDLVGVDEKTMFQLASGFGAGMGGMKATCGAVSGAIMVAGMMAQQKGYNKAETYKVCSQIPKMFEEKNKSLVCKEIKGIETGKVLRPCQDCILDAAEMLNGVIDNLNKIKNKNLSEVVSPKGFYFFNGFFKGFFNFKGLILRILFLGFFAQFLLLNIYYHQYVFLSTFTLIVYLGLCFIYFIQKLYYIFI